MNVLLLSREYFPQGTAYATRLMYLAKMMQINSWKPHIIVDYCGDKLYLNENCSGNIEGIMFEYIKSKHNKYDYFRLAEQYCRKVEDYIENNNVDLVVVGSCYDRFKRLYEIVKKHNIPIILESCERYNHRLWRFGKMDPRYHQFQRCWNNYYNKVDGVIAISSYLMKHYKNHVERTIQIPGLCDIKNTTHNLYTKNRVIRLIFAGTIGGHKETLSELILALHKLGSERKRLRLDIFGPNIMQIRKNLGGNAHLLDELANCVHVNGRIPQHEVNKQYCMSDFGVFFRPYRESSNAGFPTKLVESLAAATPVITNDTSDIAQYIKSGENGYLLEDLSIEGICQVLRKILLLTDNERIDMRRSAHRTAENYFDYRIYSDKLNQLFIDTISSNNKI